MQIKTLRCFTDIICITVLVLVAVGICAMCVKDSEDYLSHDVVFF